LFQILIQYDTVYLCHFVDVKTGRLKTFYPGILLVLVYARTINVLESGFGRLLYGVLQNKLKPKIVVFFVIWSF